MNETLSVGNSSSIELTGRAVKFSGNMATRTLYMYHCIRSTTLGPEILHQALPDGVGYLTSVEYLDFFMHHLGFFIMVGVLVNHTDGFGAVWIVCLCILALYYLHVYYILYCYTLPLRIAGQVGLIVPIGEETIGSFQNEFVTITAAQRAKYQCTDNQNFLLSIAVSRSLELKLMVYNKAWNFRNINFAGSMNVFSHFFAILIMGSVKPEGMVTAACVTYIVYYILYWIMLNRGNACCRAALSAVFNFAFTCCGCLCCQSSSDEEDLLAGLKADVEKGQLKQSEPVTYISWNCFNGQI